tara:strand:+ start:801 stop:1274 length:474 start_codon:yes stop_codon:yes gene_type:complete
MNIHLIENYNFTKMDRFMKKFEDFLIQIYITSYYKYGNGIVKVNINKRKNNIEYIPLANRNKFWDQSLDIINIKKVIMKDKKNKYYLWLIDNDISIFFERLCPLKKILFKDKRKNPKILFNNIKNAITLYKKNKEKKEKTIVEEEEEEEQVNFIINN